MELPKVIPSISVDDGCDRAILFTLFFKGLCVLDYSQQIARLLTPFRQMVLFILYLFIYVCVCVSEDLLVYFSAG